MKMLLDQLVKQYQHQQQKLPAAIYLHPVALAALVVKGDTPGPSWRGIPAKCTPVAPGEVQKGEALGVVVNAGALRGFPCDLVL